MLEQQVREEPRVLYDDQDMAVVFKPSGWSMDVNPQAGGVQHADICYVPGKRLNRFEPKFMLRAESNRHIIY